MEKKIRKLKWYISYKKEKIWLEEMALAGWFLVNITLGVVYTFIKGEPKKVLYEIDRFNLSMKPVLEEIRHKEVFLEMAKELGWECVTHDETMTYYFAKAFIPGEINELYNDEESRQYRADKFKIYFFNHAKRLIWLGVWLAAVDVWIQYMIHKSGITGMGWFNYFVLVYIVLCNGTALLMYWFSKMCHRELSMSGEEWEDIKDETKHKTIRKLIWTNRGLNRFLRREEKNGWVLTCLTLLSYSFERKEGLDEIYTLDSKWLTNKRLQERNMCKLKDNKDWNGINNDWQLQSVKDAEEKGWQFVCALENRAIIYRGKVIGVQPLNAPRYDNSLRGISLIGQYGMLMLASILAGGFIGGLLSFLR